MNRTVGLVVVLIVGLSVVGLSGTAVAQEQTTADGSTVVLHQDHGDSHSDGDGPGFGVGAALAGAGGAGYLLKRRLGS